MENKIDLLVHSINDIQGTIRALDAKFFAIIVFFLLPFSEISIIANAIKSLYSEYPCLAIIMLILTLIVWVLGLLYTFLGIYSISNPSSRVEGVSEAGTKGLFYQPNIFKMNLINGLFNCLIKPSNNLSDIIKELKIENDLIFNELVFEQVKLVFIRDVKIVRQKASIIFLLFSILLLISILILNFILQ